MPQNPHLFEMNAFLLLRRLSEKAGKKLTLATIPEKEWADLRERGVDILWLMGVWKRSPGGRQKALDDSGLRESYSRILPDWSEKDVPGSPYAVYDYSLDPYFGEDGDLRELKKRLNGHGIKLMLDFVPNHLAFDHPWTLSHPEYFISVTPEQKFKTQDLFFEAKPNVFLAYGRDPYFPSWTDTVQINYFSAAAREAMVGELLKISEVCDGVRCDMAMLMISEIFEKTWGPVTRQPKPKGEFWQKAIDCIRRKKPDFIFMAETYWNQEWNLQHMGFDFTYDKILYDRLLHSHAQEVRGHLQADFDYQKHSARFIENHDEKRAADAFGVERSQAAAIISATVPGLHFFYDGQIEGRKMHVPVQLGREPKENDVPEIKIFYDSFLKIINKAVFKEGNWELREMIPAWENNETLPNLLSWSWERGSEMAIVVVNYSAVRSQGRVTLPRRIRGSKKVSFSDGLTRVKYSYSVEEINAQGIYIDLEPWSAHILEGPVLEKEGK